MKSDLESQKSTTELGTPMETAISYTVGMLGKTKEGIILYDGKETVTLKDKTTGSVVFSEAFSKLKKVRRAEFALYFKSSGKTIAVLYGDYKSYSANVGTALSYGFTGVATTRANTINDASGIEDWIKIFETAGIIGLNASPRNMLNLTMKSVKITFIVFAVITVLLFIIPMIIVSLSDK